MKQVLVPVALPATGELVPVVRYGTGTDNFAALKCSNTSIEFKLFIACNKKIVTMRKRSCVFYTVFNTDILTVCFFLRELRFFEKMYLLRK